MDFGKINDPRKLGTISFELPSLDDRVLPGQFSKTAAPSVYVGCPIWGKKEWVGTLYPSGTPAKQFLKFYAKQFNVIELNSTFYGIPEPQTIHTWREEVPDDFRFCPKFFQGISRFEDLRVIPELTRQFVNSILKFEDQLGTSFLQLPPSFGPGHLLILKRFFLLLPKGFQLSVEFRHPGWFKNQKLIPPAFDLLAESGVGAVITDTSSRRDVIHASLTNKTAMIRFLGNALHPSDWLRIESWVKRCGEWFKLGVNQIFFFVHQPEEEGVLELAERFIEMMNRDYALNLRSWDRGLAQPQISLFD